MGGTVINQVGPFSASDTPRVFWIGVPVGAAKAVVIANDGTVGSPVAMAALGSSGIWYYDVPNGSYSSGTWVVNVFDDNDPSGTSVLYQFIWGESYQTLTENASSAATLSDQAREAAVAGASILGNNRFFQYLAGGSEPKSRLWYRNDANDAWLGYYIVYANTTTGGNWPPATPVWPTTLAEVSSFGAFVTDATGPT